MLLHLSAIQRIVDLILRIATSIMKNYPKSKENDNLPASKLTFNNQGMDLIIDILQNDVRLHAVVRVRAHLTVVKC